MLNIIFWNIIRFEKITECHLGSVYSDGYTDFEDNNLINPYNYNINVYCKSVSVKYVRSLQVWNTKTDKQNFSMTAQNFNTLNAKKSTSPHISL